MMCQTVSNKKFGANPMIQFFSGLLKAATMKAMKLPLTRMTMSALFVLMLNLGPTDGSILFLCPQQFGQHLVMEAEELATKLEASICLSAGFVLCAMVLSSLFLMASPQMA